MSTNTIIDKKKIIKQVCDSMLSIYLLTVLHSDGRRIQHELNPGLFSDNNHIYEIIAGCSDLLYIDVGYDHNGNNCVEIVVG